MFNFKSKITIGGNMENNEEKIFDAILENFKKEYNIPKK